MLVETLSASRKQLAEQYYRKKRTDIRRWAQFFASRTGADYRECVSLAEELFVVAVATWDPDKGPMGSRINFVVRMGLRDALRGDRAKKVGPDPIIGKPTKPDDPKKDALRHVPDRRQTNRIDPDILKNEVGEDAVAVLDLVLHPPLEVRLDALVIDDGSPVGRWEAVKWWLRGAGWTARRIAASMAEIREALED